MSATTALGRTFSWQRCLGLARFNLILMLRNRTTFIYGVLIPLLPLALLFAIDDLEASAAGPMIATAWLMALLFPTYYNVLSTFVARRDELVLKRLRTGETTDAELVGSMALPGALLSAVAAVLSVPIVLIAGQRFPLNPLSLLVGLAVAIATFAAFAVWTASWTKTAEAAQLTSAPVMVLAVAGSLAGALPGLAGDLIGFTPGAAVIDLINGSWMGVDVDGELSLSLADTFTAALSPLAVLIGWALLATILARRSLRWEPRI